ncbi:MAG: GlxA family transcriptional regulator [Pseudorhodoplanes sp.]
MARNPPASSNRARNAPRQDIPLLGRSILFVVLPGFSLLSLTSAIQPLRVANRLRGRPLYEWRVAARSREVVRATNGLLIGPDLTLREASNPEICVVVASQQTGEQDSPELGNFLRRQHRQGRILGAIGTATFQLARLGLLDGCNVTIHWEARDAFKEQFPRVRLTAGLFELDKKLLTCAGGIASLDMMLHLIGLEHGTGFAADISSVLLYERGRAPAEHQRAAKWTDLEQRSPILARAIRLMEENVENPLPIPRIAKQIGVTQRQLERVFKAWEDTTPSQHYLSTRLNAARELLTRTGMSLREIAIATGFVSSSHFSDSYRGRFGHAPNKERKKPGASLTPRRKQRRAQP